MKLNYFQKIIFSILQVVSGVLNLLLSTLGRNPTCDLDGKYIKSRMDNVYFKRVHDVSHKRSSAENEYKKRIREITSR